MKKLSFILALAALMPIGSSAQAETIFNTDQSFTVAKAVKLGRGNSYSVATDSTVNTGQGGQIETKKECSANCADCNTSTGKCNTCDSGYYLDNGKCVSCPSNASCSNGLSFTCNDYYYKSGNSCVGICNGVTCKSGYKAVSKATSCCCESENQCGDFQVYNPTIQKCVDQVCPLGCADMCKNGCGSCESGRYLNYNDGMCPTCSSAIANCETCTSSASGVTCTSCASGYTLSSGKCVKQITVCALGQYKDSSGNCVNCPSGCASCSSSAKCLTCKSGYSLSGNFCIRSVVSTGCSGNLQDCGTTGCCPTGNTCSYYAAQAKLGRAYCLKSIYTDDGILAIQ